MVYLVESFYSIQGEGKYMGNPSVFVRFGGCNLRCRGFGTQAISPIDGSLLIGCDTMRAVYKTHFGHQWRPLSCSQELIEIINSYLKGRDFKPDIVFTGGEPLLFYDDEVFCKTVAYFAGRGHRITIETNATIEVDFEKYPMYKSAIFSMAVKLSNVGEPYSKRINKSAIRAIVEHGAEAYFKFTIDTKIISEGALEEIDEITCDFPNSSIYCMPVGESIDSLEKNDKRVVAFCLENGFCYSDRLHIRLWNTAKGV